jgi:hypothetical protein
MKSSIKFSDHMTYIALRSTKNENTYLKMRVVYQGQDIGIRFHRGDYDEQFELWLKTAKKMFGDKKTVELWRKRKLPFKRIIAELGVEESIHYRYK